MFYEKIEKVLKEKNLTLNKLAKGAEITQSGTSRWKNGTMPSCEVLVKICKYLNVSADYLLDLENEAPPPQLSDLELELINNFRLCDSGTRKSIQLLASSGAQETLSKETSLNSEKVV